MQLADEIQRALAGLVKAGPLEVHENGRRLAGLADGLCYEVRAQGTAPLLHLWSELQSDAQNAPQSDARNVVRRVVGIAEESADHLRLEIQRFGRARPEVLEIRVAGRERPAGKLRRESFGERCLAILQNQFADEKVESLTTAARLEHSLSGCYARGIMRGAGSTAWAVLAVSAEESAATLDASLTAGLLWLAQARRRAAGPPVVGLRLFLPAGAAAVQSAARRKKALDPRVQIELFELDEKRGIARRFDGAGGGNWATHLVPRREAEAILSAAAADIARVIACRGAPGTRGAMVPQAIQACASADARSVVLRFRGLEFARWDPNGIVFGLGLRREPLTARTLPELANLVRRLGEHRHPKAHDTKHALYRAHPERWLETLVEEDPTRVDPRLDPHRIYRQVPAVTGGERGVLDLLGVTRDGRLAILELKAGEDLQLVLQAADYWLSVNGHLEQDDFRRYGYFDGIKLSTEPPRIFLVAPALRFHPATDTLLSFLRPEIEVIRVGVQENWRSGLRVSLRQ
ncbi:MAG: hypothetical protein WBE97_15615 [Candidatus Acidiferrales bacterium]